MKKFLSAVTSIIMTAGSLVSAFPTQAADALFEIDYFESYADEAALNSFYDIYQSGDSLQLSLVDGSNGGKAMSYDYSLSDSGSGYAGAVKNLGNADWSGCTGISFKASSDGGKGLTSIRFKDANGVTWAASRDLSSLAEWTEIEIPFTDFTPDSSAETPDLSSVSEFAIYAEKIDGNTPQITTTSMNVTVPQTTTTTISVDIDPDASMYVSDGKLYDGNGNEFLMKGLNLPHAWYTDYTEVSINAVADLGANTVRVVLGEGSNYTKTSKAEVEQIIEWSRNRGLVCVLEIHDFTGDDDPADITENAVSYWTEMIDLINENKDYVIVNIANEWQGTWDKDTLWADTYKTAIKSLRDNGLESAIMVDASGYGQETKYLIRDCKDVLAADEDENTMFSLHMYSVVGADSSTIKTAIDDVKAQGVCLVIGEFGYWQNFNGVDERYLVDYCTENDIGWLAWSWKGNGGYDQPLDMSNDWAGSDLTPWGEWVFAGKNGIQETSRLAYTLQGYNGEKSAENVPDSVPDPELKAPDAVVGDTNVALSAGVLTDYDWTWGISGDAEDPCVITKTEPLSNGGIRANVNLEEENYPTMIAVNSEGWDLSAYSTLDLVVRNNNANAVQINLIMKAGDGWKWYEPNTPASYIDVPGSMTQQISFDIIAVGADLADVKQIAFRIQPSSGIISNPIDFISMGYDLAEGAYEDEISELNRPKSANYFTWDYPEASFEGTVSSGLSEDGVLTIEYDGITNEIGAGIQTETRPGLGVGLDMTKYEIITATLTNKGNTDVHCTLIVKNGSDWTWAENGGTASLGGSEGEMIIPAGESVKVYYYLNHATWKSAASGWAYTGTLSDLDDVRAIAFKLYTGGESASGTFEISDFSVHTSETIASEPQAAFASLTPDTITVASSEKKGGMYVDGTKLCTADGTEFMMRGINIAHTWFKDATIGAIRKSAEYGSNATRIVLSDDSYAANGWQGYKDDAATVEKLIQECRANGQVAIVEYHNGTGGDGAEYVDKAVAYWLEMAEMLNSYKDCCVLNILNEWQGTWNLSTYAPTYQSAIRTLRDAGIENVIMIDAPGWGQDANTMIQNAQSILESDPDKNVMFSIHMYAVAGADENTVKSHIDNALAKNICLCIGEFGCNHKMNGQIYDVAWQTILDYCQQKSVGWLAWSWCGNGSDDYFLDLVTDQAGGTLTEWGRNVVYGRNGMMETSVKLGEQPVVGTDSVSGTWYFDDIAVYGSESAIVYGDADLDGEVTINDVVKIMLYVTNSGKYPLTAEEADNADVYQRGDGISNMDALSVSKRLAQMINSLPESFAA